ncbi:MAG: M24 family metallopeptidase [Chlamydiia bacterium]|nr:M24 family metallopeptidase [Chlamydiia bacterium]
MNIKSIQQQLRTLNIDGWLLYEFHGKNPLALEVLQLPEGILMTRRCFYWIPKEGNPIKIVHQIEAHNLDHLEGDKKSYFSFQEMQRVLGEILKGMKTVAMEYSPLQAIPTVSVVDGGLIDLVRSFGVEVVSSAPLLQPLTSIWTEKQYALHHKAAKVLEWAVTASWKLIETRLLSGEAIDEYEVQTLILDHFEKENCVTEGKPICAVNAHSADPHYIPTKKRSSPIQRGDFVLIDLWCKKNEAEAVFADITRVGVAAPSPTPKQQEVFTLVREAQRVGTDLIKRRMEEGKEVMGAEVDAAVRAVIEKGGYGSYFTHRTGHHIHTENHGPGANLDSIETEDTRPLIPKTCFSIEPGIYLPGEFGVRLEYDVYLHQDRKVEITLPPQDALVVMEKLG